MKVSIITVVFNGRNSIEDTIRSVINQSYSSFEYICVDGGSTDGTVALLESYRKYFSHLLVEPDSGIYYAMNKGVDLAVGDWVIFMNSGDTFYDSLVLERVFSYERSFHNIGVVFGDFVLKSVVGIREVRTKDPFFKQKSFIKNKGICHQSVFVRTKLARRFPFDVNFRISADFKMLYNLYYHGFRFYHVPEFVCFYSVDQGKSKENQVLAWKEDAMITGIFKSFRFKLHFFFRVLGYQLRICFSRIIRVLFPKLFVFAKRIRSFS